MIAIGRKARPHRFIDGVEQKLCSTCKEYKPISEYNKKKDRSDGLSNECFKCISLRNKRRHDPTFVFPDDIETREEIEQYLNEVRYKTPNRLKEKELIENDKKE